MRDILINSCAPMIWVIAFLELAFSAIGPATGNSDLIFYISMYGELLMIIFLCLFIIKKEKKLI